MAEKRSPAVFLDRDGTLMRDVDFCDDPNEVHLFPGVPEALHKLKERGYTLFIITNQSGIGRGYFTEEQYREVERELLRQIGDGVIDATYVCPHAPDAGCKCRKPSPEMIFKAAHDYPVDLGRSFFIGDKSSDLECGRTAGLRRILVRTGYGKGTDDRLADFVARDLAHAADIIIEETE